MRCPFCKSENIDTPMVDIGVGEIQCAPASCGDCLAYQNDDGTWMAGAYKLIKPQPVVRRIASGWDISGIPCFMGTAEHHIQQDARFNVKGRVFKLNNNWMEMINGEESIPSSPDQKS